MFGITPQELLLIMVVALIVVGPRKLPELGRSLGKGLREIRKAQDEVRKSVRVDLDDERPLADRSRRPARALPEEGPGSPAPSEPSSVSDVSRTLGRGLAELRRAREEVQRSFRVEMDEPAGRRPSTPAPLPPATPADGSAVGAGDADGKDAGPTPE